MGRGLWFVSVGISVLEPHVLGAKPRSLAALIGFYMMSDYSLSWGIFDSSTDTSIYKVRGQVEPALVWSLEYMALPDYLMREDNRISYRPKTFVFIIGKS